MDLQQSGQLKGDGALQTDGHGRPIENKQVDISKSTLSATAAVFVPRNFQPAAPTMVPQQMPPHAMPMHHQQHPMYHQHPPPQQHQNNRNMHRGYDDRVDPMEQLRHVVKVTIASPGTFDEMIVPLTELLNREIKEEKALKEIVDELFVQSVRESNFRYTGARICNVFSNHLNVSFSSGNFRQLLLGRCHDEHVKHEEMLSQLQTRAHVIGFTIFLAELLTNMEGQGESEHMLTLVKQIRELMHTFLKRTDDGCLRCVVQTLKLSGAILEDVEKAECQGSCEGLEAVFEKIKTVLLQENLSRSAKAMLLSVVELRAKDWGRKESDSHLNGSQMAQQLPQGPVMFDQSGQAFPAPPEAFGPGPDNFMGRQGEFMAGGEMYWPASEDEYFDFMCSPDGEYSSWGGDDEFDDEIAAAFEEFMLENDQRSAQQNAAQQQQNAHPGGGFPQHRGPTPQQQHQMQQQQQYHHQQQQQQQQLQHQLQQQMSGPPPHMQHRHAMPQPPQHQPHHAPPPQYMYPPQHHQHHRP